MYMTIAELPEFSRRAQHLLTEEEIDELIEFLAIHPQAGVIMQGTGGVRKLRWARESKGKSGGTRVIYYFHNENIPLFLLTIYGIGEKDNLSKAERNQLAKLVKILVATN
ncbi:addiction module toxin RelE [candidate division KSB1 bacterium]|nr:MAG: addiction module toxin RelE [candidate division KSB1 bacterium]MBC6951806.1 addiction module toxin RelE [candidate division KSB1 bacterium]MCE7942466.1 addiction module toxin RelE [Chlorobi bacterium CHB1]MDL1876980.1 addiction module toxin RelE [Cytophagia bacterium CHB2]